MVKATCQWQRSSWSTGNIPAMSMAIMPGQGRLQVMPVITVEPDLDGGNGRSVSVEIVGSFPATTAKHCQRQRLHKLVAKAAYADGHGKICQWQ